MGVVFVAQHNKMDRKVAIKTMLVNIQSFRDGKPTIPYTGSLPWLKYDHQFCFFQRTGTCMSTVRCIVTTIAVASLPGVAVAHPGHGKTNDGTSFLHYATSPLHWLPVLGATFGFAIAMYFLSLQSKRIRVVATDNR
jgi:hypothetical protein